MTNPFKSWAFQGLLESSYKDNPLKKKGLSDRTKQEVRDNWPQSFIRNTEYVRKTYGDDSSAYISTKQANDDLVKIGTRARNIQDIRWKRVAKEKEESRKSNKQRHENPQGLFSKMRKDKVK